MSPPESGLFTCCPACRPAPLTVASSSSSSPSLTSISSRSRRESLVHCLLGAKVSCEDPMLRCDSRNCLLWCQPLSVCICTQIWIMSIPASSSTRFIVANIRISMLYSYSLSIKLDTSGGGGGNTARLRVAPLRLDDAFASLTCWKQNDRPTRFS